MATAKTSKDVARQAKNKPYQKSTTTSNVTKKKYYKPGGCVKKRRRVCSSNPKKRRAHKDAARAERRALEAQSQLEASEIDMETEDSSNEPSDDPADEAPDDDASETDSQDEVARPQSPRRPTIDSEHLRNTIAFFYYDNFDGEDPNVHKGEPGLSIYAQILKWMRRGRGTANIVKTVVDQCWECHQKGVRWKFEDFDARKNGGRIGLKDMNRDLIAIY